LGLIGGLSARRSNSCLPRREEERGREWGGEGRGEERREGEGRQGKARRDGRSRILTWRAMSRQGQP